MPSPSPAADAATEFPPCTNKVTTVTNGVGMEHLECALPAGHDGEHRDGTTTWHLATIYTEGANQAAGAATDLTPLHVEAFDLIAKALNIPNPAITEQDQRQYDQLAQRRGDAVWILAAKLSAYTHRDDVDAAIETFRVRVDQLPVLYRPHGQCGPGCVASVDGVHDSCPGPHADATVEDAR